MRLKLSLKRKFQFRIPTRDKALYVVYTNGDPASIYWQIGPDPARRIPIAESYELERFTHEDIYIVNEREQNGYILIETGIPGYQLTRPVVTSPVKAYDVVTGTITVGTTEVRGPSVVAAPGRAVVLKADPGNLDVIELRSSPGGTGFPLNPGDSIELLIENLDRLYFYSPTDGQILRYIVETPQGGEE